SPNFHTVHVLKLQAISPSLFQSNYNSKHMQELPLLRFLRLPIAINCSCNLYKLSSLLPVQPLPIPDSYSHTSQHTHDVNPSQNSSFHVKDWHTLSSFLNHLL